MAAASTSRDPDRLVLFTDAVVAIAITLLVLPLVDLVPEVWADGGDAVSVINEHRQEIYTRTILALSICQSALTWMVHGHSELEKPDNPVQQGEIVGSLLLTGLTLLAFLLASLVPGVNFYAMFLLLLSPIISRVWKGRSRTRTGAQP